MGVIAEVDLTTGKTIREIDMSPSDDGPTSPHFAPAWYRGSLVPPNEYLFADFGGTKRGPTSTGGIWKFGSDIAVPQRLLSMPAGAARVHALAFGRDQLFVARINGNSGSLATYDGQQLVELPTETLPSIGSLAFDVSDDSLLTSEFDGRQILRIDLSKPGQPAAVKLILSGFHRLNFGVLSFSADCQRLAVVDFGADTTYVLSRAARDARRLPAAPLKLEPGAQLPSVINATGVALGDLDGDGDADLVMTCIGGDNRVWLNDGQGTFTDSEQSLELDEGTSVALGDLDQDGDLDLFLTGNQGNQVWSSDGHGRFQASKQRLGDGKCEAVELVDFDADHDHDAVTIPGGWSGSQARIVWLNDGQGRFSKGPALATGNSQSLASGDLDGDGDADIVFGNLNQPAEVWLNQSNQSTIP